MTQEEATVRAAYASVVLASRVQAVMDSHGASHAPGLSIQLTDFRQGPISELLDRVLSDEVTVPSGEVLQCTPGTWSWATSQSESKHIGTTLNVGSWVPATRAFGEFGNRPEHFHVPFSQVFQQLGWHPTTWVSYTVLLSAHGSERRYKAMFFWDPTAAAASDQVRPIDYVLGQSVLIALMRSSLAEDIAALPVRTEGSGAVELRDSALVSAACLRDSVTRLCCDPDTLRCGIKPE